MTSHDFYVSVIKPKFRSRKKKSIFSGIRTNCVAVEKTRHEIRFILYQQRDYAMGRNGFLKQMLDEIGFREQIGKVARGC